MPNISRRAHQTPPVSNPTQSPQTPPSAPASTPTQPQAPAQQSQDQHIAERAEGSALAQISLEATEANTTPRTVPLNQLPPKLAAALESMYPGLKEVEIVGESHARPFHIYQLNVGDTPLTAVNIWGGFVPSDDWSISAGHQGAMDSLNKPTLNPPSPPAQPLPDLIPPGTLEDISRAPQKPIQAEYPKTVPLSDLPLKLQNELRQLFPNLETVEILAESHEHPVHSYSLNIEGEDWTAYNIFGGIVPSNDWTLQRGHGGLFGT